MDIRFDFERCQKTYYELSSVPLNGYPIKYTEFCDCESKALADKKKSCGCGMGRCEKGLIF